MPLDTVPPAAKPELEPDKRKRAARRPVSARTKQTARSRSKRGVVITNRAEIIQHSKILIIALQEALDYDPLCSNQRPPALWSDDPGYLGDVGALVVELRRLNSLLEAKRPSKKEANRAVIDLARHFDTFLHAYASWFGKGAAVLTLGAIANLLRQAGLDPAAVCAAIKLPR